ncbi:hypothetical protein AVEN_43973-1 [Araneus ventricosus]|uniref:Uncharacterized protein n=1 Tax=Araneus ventricosus TaxID=182803 RepID=A0A4Y2QXQ1_ARAVE|nr:hypothetical protein AVEN_43973-1 [Araneus ventricosus]
MTLGVKTPLHQICNEQSQVFLDWQKCCQICLNFWQRTLHSIDELQNDLRSAILKDTFVPEITSFLNRYSKFMTEVKDVAEMQQDLRKECGDRK